MCSSERGVLSVSTRFEERIGGVDMNVLYENIHKFTHTYTYECLKNKEKGDFAKWYQRLSYISFIAIYI